MSAGPGDAGDVPAVHVYRRRHAFSRSTVVQAIAWPTAIAEIMLRERPHAVQIGTAGEGYLALWLRRWLGLPYIVYAYGNEVLAAERSVWDKPRLALRNATRVLAISRFTAGLVQRCGVPADRITVLHPGCDAKHFRPLHRDRLLQQRLLGRHAQGPILLTVGGLVPRKGHDIVIRAMPQVLRCHPGTTYVIVSNGLRYFQALDVLAREVGVRNAIVFVNGITRAELPAVYALADIFVMPSRENLDECDVEGFGIVYVEAAACGKPTVAGRSGGIPDAVVDGVTGVLVDPQSPEAVAAAINRLLGDSDLRIRLGVQGRQRVERELTWHHVGERVQSIVETM